MKHFWRAETGLFLGIWLVLMVIGRSQLFHDQGTFWHTVSGRLMLASGQLIRTDPFSFTREGQPWVPFEWLAECVMAAVHEISGLDGLLLVTVTALAGVYTWVGHRLIRSGLHWLPTTLVVIWTIAASSTNLHVRPHIASIVFLAITFALLCDFEAGRISLPRLFWLVPLFVLWTNWHGAVLGGFATLGLAVAGWSVARIFRQDSPIRKWRQAVPLFLLVIACGMTALVNPYGARLPATWLQIMSSPVVPRLIIEHAPPSPRKLEFWIILSLGLGYALLLLSTLPRRPRITWLIPVVWFALSMSRVRHAPLFGIVAMIALAEILPQTRLASWLARPGRDLFRLPVATSDLRVLLIPVVLVLASVGLQTTNVRVPILGRGWARLDPLVWPVELIPELRRIEDNHPEGARMFNDYQFGGFLIYQTPRLKVFIDDRCELYGDAWLEQFDRASTVEPSLLEDWLARYRIDSALVVPGSTLDRRMAQQTGWSIVGRCPSAVLYGRAFQAPRPDPLLSASHPGR